MYLDRYFVEEGVIFVRHTEFFSDSEGSGVFGVDDGYEAVHAESVESVVTDGFCGLGCVAVTPVVSVDSEGDFDIFFCVEFLN